MHTHTSPYTRPYTPRSAHASHQKKQGPTSPVSPAGSHGQFFSDVCSRRRLLPFPHSSHLLEFNDSTKSASRRERTKKSRNPRKGPILTSILSTTLLSPFTSSLPHPVIRFCAGGSQKSITYFFFGLFPHPISLPRFPPFNFRRTTALIDQPTIRNSLRPFLPSRLPTRQLHSTTTPPP